MCLVNKSVHPTSEVLQTDGHLVFRVQLGKGKNEDEDSEEYIILVCILYYNKLDKHNQSYFTYEIEIAWYSFAFMIGKHFNISKAYRIYNLG